MAIAGRKRNPAPSQSKRLALNPATMEYLEGIALTGIHGNSWTDVAKKFIGDGIAQALRDRVVPRRKSEVPYETVDDQGQE
jgi:hypothetical protein